MKPFNQCVAVALCAAAWSLSGCSNAAAPGTGSSAVTMAHAAPKKVIRHFDGVVPNHVLTWAWIKQRDNVSPAQAAPYVDWAAVQVADANAFSQAGIKTAYYTDPNRTYAGQPMYSQDETTFAHDCAGNRITVNGRPGPTYQMDPRSPNLLRLWTAWVDWALQGGVHFDAIFDDSADSVHNDSALPCNFDQTAWSTASNLMNTGFGLPIIYNGLGTLANGVTNPPPSIALNSSVLGGMLEGCYGNIGSNNPLPKKAVWQNFENSELTMSAVHKTFVCRSLNSTPAQTAYDQRLYMYASFLLTYDVTSSIISEKFSTPSNLEVYPESGLVALDPLVQQPLAISGLLTAPYTFGRQYADCYLNGQAIGSCATVVNADGPNKTHPFPWPGVYSRTLVLNGAGVLDGGTASVSGPAPGVNIPGATGEIAIQ
jgi:hypothetical protein